MSSTPTPEQKEQAKGTISIADLQRYTEALAEAVSRRGVPTVGLFPLDALPAPIQAICRQTCHHLQHRPDWIGASILYAASVAVGNAVGCRYLNWPQVGTLYLALVGLPGTNKSGPPEFALRPLRRADSDLYRQHKATREEFDGWAGLSKKERLAQGMPVRMEAPVYKTLLVSDVTPEALALTHQNNPVGLGLFVDELAGWFQNFNRYNKGSEQEFWLQNWSLSPVRIVRKSSGPVLIDRPFIAVAGTIQPGILRQLAQDGRDQNGFLDRILFAFPDDQFKPYDAEAEMSGSVEEEYSRFLEKLLTLRQNLVFDETGAPQTRYLCFDPDAFAEMRRWKDQNTDRINATDDPSLRGIHAKMDTHCVRIALVLELMAWACGASDLGAIGADTVRRAVRLTEYFRQNAEKVHYVLHEQTAAERLPPTQQRLYEALPEEFVTAEALQIARGLKVAERTAMRLMRDAKLFERLRHGQYQKRC